MPPYRYDPVQNPHAMSIAETLARRGDIAAQRALSVAQAQSQAQQARGQVWGNAVQNIGQAVSGAVQTYAREKQEAPIRAQQMELGRLQNEAARLQISSARQAAEDKSILGSAQGSGLAPDQVKAQLQQLGRGDLIPIYEQTHASLESARLGLQEQRTKVANLESDYFGALAAGVKRAKLDPVAIEWALAQADADGHDTKQIRELLKQNPQAMPQIIDALIEKSPTQRKLIGEEADRALKTQQEARALADTQADNARQAATAAETARHNAAVERINALTAGRQQAQAEETERHNRAMEENARNAKTGRPVIAGDAEAIAAMDEAIQLSGGLNFKPGDTGIMPSIGGAMPDAVTNITGFGVGAKQRQGVINLSKQIIGKGLEGGVLRKEDEYKYEKIIPTLSDHPDVVESKVKNMIATIEKKREARLNAMEDAGYNVSRFHARAARGNGGESGVMVNMKAPDGRPLQVPAEQVDEAKRRGATVVGQ